MINQEYFEEVAEKSTDAKEKCLAAIVVLLADIGEELYQFNCNYERSLL